MKQQTDIDVNLIYDFVFSLIKENAAISLESLYSKYESEFQSFSIDIDQLHRILSFWIEDKKMFLDPKNNYRLEPIARNFTGRSLSTVKVIIDTKKQSKKDSFFKIIPLVLTILFGITTIIFSYLNYAHSADLKSRDKAIDSLNTRLTNLTIKYEAIVDSIK